MVSSITLDPYSIIKSLMEASFMYLKIGLPPPLDASTDSSRQPLPSRSTMSFLFDDAYYKVGKNGLSPAQNMCAYLGGSAIQTVGAGNDMLEGGAGTDTASYKDSSTGVTVSLASGTGLGGDAEGDTVGHHHWEPHVVQDDRRPLRSLFGCLEEGLAQLVRTYLDVEPFSASRCDHHVMVHPADRRERAPRGRSLFLNSFAIDTSQVGLIFE